MYGNMYLSVDINFSENKQRSIPWEEKFVGNVWENIKFSISIFWIV